MYRIKHERMYMCVISLHHTTPHAIHGSLDIASDLEPVCSSLSILVDFLCTENALEAVVVGDDGCQFLGVRWGDQVDLREFAQGFEVEQQLAVFQRLDVFEVVVHITVLVSK